ncbi:MAG TPA: PAS domain S-box protein [Candidatus Melainabacteria bacterium]|jgi:PAS domain S-box-containing protein|nr:PAS domain S-box protein [Candidatus Melainabacteria bacterium]HIN65586.1 PAS domain S-box protein [Candidatus Obscuribacterales bacterium]
MILVLVPVVIELAFLGIVGNRLYQATKEYERLERSRHALIQLHHFEKVAEDAILALAQEDDALSEKKIADIDTLINALEIPWTTANSFEHPELNAIVRDSESARVNLISVLKQVRLRLIRHIGRTVPAGKLLPKASTITMFMEVRPLSKRIIEVETDMLDSDSGQIESLTWKLSVILASGAGIGFLISLWLVRDFTAGFLNRLTNVANKALLLAGGRDLPPPIEGNDELAELDKVLLQAHTDLKQARQKQFAILDNARDVLCTLDGRLRFITVGEAANKVWLYSPDELLGLSLISMVSEQTQEVTRQQLSKLAETGGDCEFENDVKRKDGTVQPFLWKVSHSKEQASYFCVAHNISEMKAAQQLKQQFLTTASEELRAPINEVNSLIGSIVNANSEAIPKAAQEELAKANFNLMRLSDLVAELLDLEDVEAAGQDIDKHPVSAAEICRQARLTLEALAASRGIKIVQLPTDAIIYGDNGRLIQALINLLSNAIKFSPNDSTVNLDVATSATTVTISVIDQGPGIPEKDKELVFAKFQQSESANKSKIKGSGLGLALVKSIAEAHDGTAGYKPVPTGGSCFYIEIPKTPEGGVE